MNKSLVRLILATVFLSQFSDVLADDSKLIAVAVMYREGHTSPSSSFPNDPYFDASYWPMGFGQLTEQGITHQYELGQWLRQRYDGFLPQKYSRSDIYVLSSDTHPTLMSAEANLAGLYPPADSQVWNQNLLWQPIPVHTVPRQLDQVLYMERPCAQYKQLYDDVYNNGFYQEINEIYAGFYEEIGNLTGWEIDDVSYLHQLQAVLDIYSNYNTSFLPDWYSTLNLDRLGFLSSLDLLRYTYNADMRHFGDGPFFDYLTKHFDGVLNNTEGVPKFLMLSAHDTTIISVLNGLAQFDHQTPEFASCLIWELRNNENDGDYVNLFFKKNATEDAQFIKLFELFGEENCHYTTFKRVLEPVTVDLDTWDEECANIDGHVDEEL